MATHSSVLAWRIPGTPEPGGLLSLGSHSRTRLKRLSSSSSRLVNLENILRERSQSQLTTHYVIPCGVKIQNIP